MKKSSSIIECVPNFSEGKDQKIIASIADAIRSVEEVKLLHIDIGAAANRTVMTFAGNPEKVLEAAFRAIKKASELIDMRQHQGEHPRIGATDVCPLIPIANIELEEVVKYANRLAQRVGEDLKIPVYLYETAATHPTRKNLANIRKGAYEGLETKMKEPNWYPDFGGESFNVRAGATVIGVRNFLIAYNINLDTTDVNIAQAIAAEIRESGKVMVENGEKKRIAGKCKALKAIGWYIEEYQKAQVSMNLVNFNITGMHQAMKACRIAGQQYGVEVTGSELIGLVPLKALLDAGRFYRNDLLEENDLLETAVKFLGLDELETFQVNERVIEYVMALR